MSKSLNKSMFFLSRVKNFLPLNCRKQLYFAHIHSHLVYCLPLLSMAYKTDLSKLEKLQRKALRITYNVGYRADTLPLADLIERFILKFMHNIYSYGKPPDFKTAWEVTIKNIDYPLRNYLNFKSPLVKSIRVSQLPQFKFAEIFNQFPKDFKWIMEGKTFLDNLREYYHLKYKIPECQKKFCRNCCFEAWRAEQLKHIKTPKTLNYIRYNAKLRSETLKKI